MLNEYGIRGIVDGNIHVSYIQELMNKVYDGTMLRSDIDCCTAFKLCERNYPDVEWVRYVNPCPSSDGWKLIKEKGNLSLHFNAALDKCIFLEKQPLK